MHKGGGSQTCTLQTAAVGCWFRTHAHVKRFEFDSISGELSWNANEASPSTSGSRRTYNRKIMAAKSRTGWDTVFGKFNNSVSKVIPKCIIKSK